MLDSATRHRIDTARDILVGKVPDPKSQVEQITIALIYKFMDDMDAESEELGGSRSFFAGDFEKYGWARLMRPGLGGHEMLNLYAEAITRMPENPGIPPLFRSIFKNAYLPYRDPETLRLFLKVIDEFIYDHSERLGDAFEYLLSVLGSQGDAGQFRTPRHIIDFIVEVIDPKKNEKVLDPACGTAGFLISSWKHILKANTDAKGNSTLTPDEKRNLAANFSGYDISPDMVRLSQVNMYLHGFADPHIYEYDTLTSLDKWNEHADVILANPPFMSPKGGIRPHNRFTVQSKRSEVLFVDYMAEHLTPNGRAGIIVPEGIIFQSGTAYKQLRKLLVEEYLVAVVSLPAGVFNPYSGVKTSILILDRSLARRTDSIVFFKVQNDGFSLGAQRREIDKNDLPQAAREITDYLSGLRAGETPESPSLGLIVKKEKIAANGDWNLSGERYRESSSALTKFPYRAIKDIALEIRAGFASGQSSTDIVGVPHIRPMNISEAGQFVPDGMKYISEEEYRDREDYCLEAGDVLFNNTNSIDLIGKTCLIEHPLRCGYSNHMTRIRVNPDLCVPRYLALVLHSAWHRGQFRDRATRWVGQAGINTKSLADFEIPLPPLEVQKEIVAEIEGYKKVINGARMVVDNYRPHISIDPAWPLIPLKEVAIVASGFGFPLDYQGKVDEEVPFLKVSDMNLSGNEERIIVWNNSVSRAILSELRAEAFPKGTVIFPKIGAAIATNKKRILTRDSTYDNNVMGVIPDIKRLLPEFFHTYLLAFDLSNWASESQPPSMRKTTVEAHEIPLPPLFIQQEIVAEIDVEQALVASNRDLIARFEKKIQSTLARVWEDANNR